MNEQHGLASNNAPDQTSGKKERFLRLSSVRDRIPYSRATIYRLIADGKFPRPCPLGAGAVAWREAEIDDWVAARIASRQPAEAN